MVDEEPQTLRPGRLHGKQLDLRLSGGESLLDVDLELVGLHIPEKKVDLAAHLQAPPRRDGVRLKL
jgi:hypothetical protein